MEESRAEAKFLECPGARSALRIRTDIAHTWAIGVGKEFCASALVTICDILVHGPSLDSKLEDLYSHFREWCSRAHETCKLNEFSKKTLKIQTQLG